MTFTMNHGYWISHNRQHTKYMCICQAFTHLMLQAYSTSLAWHGKVLALGLIIIKLYMNGFSHDSFVQVFVQAFKKSRQLIKRKNVAPYARQVKSSELLLFISIIFGCYEMNRLFSRHHGATFLHYKNK